MPRRPLPSAKETPATMKQKILVVDDEQALTGFLSELLQGRGYQVAAVNDSQEALSIYLDDPDAIDLVISDQTMPKMTGLELSRALLQVRPELPIILCSGYSDELTEESIRDTGIRKFFPKPLETKTLTEAVAKILR